MAGWKFDHFEWTQSRNDGPDKSGSSYSNPTTGTRYNYLHDYTCDFGPTYEAKGIVDEVYSVTYCRAVFVEDATYGDITVTTTPDPAAGGSTTPTTETHQYAGSPSTTFTLTATANNGYRFLNWKLNGTVVATTNTTSVTHTFTSSAQTFHYVAEFLQSSGLILHGSGGTILHGSGGSILHSG